MKCASIADTKAHLSAFIADIESGEEVIITRRGKPVACLTAVPQAEPPGWTDLAAWINQEPPPTGLSVAEMREQDLL